MSCTVRGKNKNEYKTEIDRTNSYKNNFSQLGTFFKFFSVKPTYCFKQLENGYLRLELWPIMVQMDDCTVNQLLPNMPQE